MDKVESLAKARAIHRPQGWIASFRSKVQHLLEGKITLHEYVTFDILLHLVGWDKRKPDYGRIEGNVSRLHQEWFPFWSRPMLIKQLSGLKDKGYIEMTREWVSIPNFAKYQSVTDRKSVTPVTLDPETTEESVTPVTPTVTPVTESVTPVTVERPQTGTMSESCEPKPINQYKPIENSKNIPPSGGVLDRFPEFWSAYPKKEGKKACVEYWKKLKPSDDLMEKILAGLERYKQTQTVKSGYIKDPIKWLRGEHWEDEYAIPQGQNQDDFWDARRFQQ